MNFGWQELLIILIIALLLFGGTRLAGIGKASGRAIREFKEETRDLKNDRPSLVQDAPRTQTVTTETVTTEPVPTEVLDGEVIDRDTRL